MVPAVVQTKWLANGGALLLRLGLGSVLIAFGSDKFVHQTNWLIYVPASLAQALTTSPWLTVYRFLWLQGLLELILGLQLVIGLMTRGSAIASTVLLAAILAAIGFEQFWQISIRDVGLLCSSTALACLGAGEWSLDAWLHRPSSQGEAAR